jgi:hypothetical protein
MDLLPSPPRRKKTDPMKIMTEIAMIARFLEFIT